VRQLTLDAPAAGSASTAAFPEILPGLISAFRFKSDGSATELPIDEPIVERSDGWLWLHFNLADMRACHFLRLASSIPASARELLVTGDEHQQLHATETCLYGVFADLVYGLDGITEEIGFLHFAITERLLVSGRRRALKAVDATRKALRNGRKVKSAAALLEAIVQQEVDTVDRYAEQLADTLDRVEEKILLDDVSEGRQVLGRIRRTTVRLHRQLVILRSLIHRFELDRSQPARHALKLATAQLSQRLDWLDTEIVSLRDRAQLLQEEVTIKTAEQTNRNLHVLAVVTTIFLPATLVVGIFGMNVRGLPFTGDDSGFLWSMAILGGASAGVFWLLKRSGILGR
jgi:zinc transporter